MVSKDLLSSSLKNVGCHGCQHTKWSSIWGRLLLLLFWDWAVLLITLRGWVLWLQVYVSGSNSLAPQIEKSGFKSNFTTGVRAKFPASAVLIIKQFSKERTNLNSSSYIVISGGYTLWRTVLRKTVTGVFMINRDPPLFLLFQQVSKICCLWFDGVGKDCDDLVYQSMCTGIDSADCSQKVDPGCIVRFTDSADPLVGASANWYESPIAILIAIDHRIMIESKDVDIGTDTVQCPR